MELEKTEQNESKTEIQNEINDEEITSVTETENSNLSSEPIQEFEDSQSESQDQNAVDDIKTDYPLTIGDDEYEAGYPRTIADDEYEVGHPKDASDEFYDETTNLTRKKYKFYTDGYIFSFLMVFFAVFSSFIFVFNYLFHPIKVVGKSMQPTINANVYYINEDDSTHCDIVYYMQAEEYNTNDIVIVLNTDYKYIPKSEGDDVSSVIKRVIAKPGQSIRFYLLRQEMTQDEDESSLPPRFYYGIEVFDENGKNINIDQSYLDESREMYCTAAEIYYFSKQENEHFKLYYEIFKDVAYDPSHEYIYTVEDDHYFVMGDNRNNSTDSRYFGAVSSEDIAGSVRIIMPYGSNLFSAIWNTLKKYINQG